MQKKPYNQGFSLLIRTKLSRLLPTSSRTQRALRVHFVSSYYNNGCLLFLS